LPKPDILEGAYADTASFLVTDDGSTLTAQLSQALLERGWDVIILQFPKFTTSSTLSLPSKVNIISLQDWSEGQLQQKLSNLPLKDSSLAGFIHLHPIFSDLSETGLCFRENEHEILKQVFLSAKYLKVLLQAVPQGKRSSYLNVVRQDGTFGLTGNADFSPLGGGLFGLTKSLNHEWRSIFCRAIDIAPNIESKQAAQHILSELYDPNCMIVDVGYSHLGRNTLAPAIN
jgi:hypothetical protein